MKAQTKIPQRLFFHHLLFGLAFPSSIFLVTAGDAARLEDEADLRGFTATLEREQLKEDGLRRARLVPDVARRHRIGQHKTGALGRLRRLEYLRFVFRGQLFRAHKRVVSNRYSVKSLKS